MDKKPTYGDLEARVAALEKTVLECRDAERNLQESEIKYRSLVENIPDVIYSLDASFKVAAVNLPASDFYGYSREEVLGHDFSRFIHPEDGERIVMSFVEAIETRREWTRGLEFRMVAKDGSEHWVELNSHMQFDDAGNYKREEGVIRDITVRKKAENALQAVHRGLEKRIEKRTAELVEVNQKLRQEIKERTQAETELKNSEEKLGILFKYAPDAYFLTDLNRKIIDGNRAAERLTGYRKEELAGRDFVDAGLLSKDQASSLGRFDGNLDELRAGPMELTFCRKDGQQRCIEINAFPVRISGRDIILSIARDITERKQADADLRKWQEELEERVEKRTQDLAAMNEELQLKTNSLRDANTALKVLLKQRDNDQHDIEERILSNLNELVVPLTERLKASPLDERQKAWVDILETNLRDIVSPFSRELNSKFWRLTPTEFQVANFIKNGKTTKEISKLLMVATSTIDTYRDNIRKKLGIKNKKINLKTYLMDIK